MCTRNAMAALLAVAAGATALATDPAEPPLRGSVTFSGRIAAGQSWRRDFADGLRVVLAPRRFGWEIVVEQEGRTENLARLTPPFHFVPNPRDIEGWHFRNADNSGPNQPGENNVNAPGEVREFAFSPAVGATIDGPQTGRAPTPAEVDEVRRWGQGTLTILEYELADLVPGETARFAWMRFSLTLTWPATPWP